MNEKTYNILLTIILVIISLALIIGGGVIAYNIIKDNNTNAQADDTATNLQKKLTELSKTKEHEKTESNVEDIVRPNLDNENTSTTNAKKNIQLKMEDYNVVGLLEIPKIKIKYPILETASKRALEISIAMLETDNGVNEVGNTTILGHNYRNNMFFSKNRNLKNGDKVKITDMEGTTIEYVIYDMKYVSPSETSFMRRDTDGKREITLSTCNDDSSERLVILAREN